MHDSAEIVGRYSADTAHSRVEIVAGNDSVNCLGAMLLFRAWGLEKYGREMDQAAWMTQWQAEVASGTFVQVVAWDGPIPVAMVRIHMHYDVFQHHYEGWGDKAYALPDYRGEGLWSRTVDAILELAKAMGCVAGIAPTGADELADRLGAMYERRGFVLTGRAYRKEVL